MNRGLLHLLLCLLLAFMGTPAWAHCRPENRVGGSAVFSSVFASQEIVKPIDTSAKNPACGYDFASGVHKYLYCHNNPINMVDPSGHDDIGDVLGAMDIFSGLSAMISPVASTAASSSSYNGMTDAEKAQVTKARSEAKNYADEANAFMSGIGYNNPGARYIRWYGAADRSRIDNVKDAWTRIDGALQNGNLSFTAHKPQYFAYANGSSMDYFGCSIWGTRSLFPIRLGDDFWTAPLTGEDSQAGTIVHELSHMYYYTHDYDYGSDDCKALATDKPSKAISNADNYEFFVELK